MSYQIVNFKKLAFTKFGVHTSMFIDTSVQNLAKSFKKTKYESEIASATHCGNQKLNKYI